MLLWMVCGKPVNIYFSGDLKWVQKYLFLCIKIKYWLERIETYLSPSWTDHCGCIPDYMDDTKKNQDMLEKFARLGVQRLGIIPT